MLKMQAIESQLNKTEQDLIREQISQEFEENGPHHLNIFNLYKGHTNH